MLMPAVIIHLNGKQLSIRITQAGANHLSSKLPPAMHLAAATGTFPIRLRGGKSRTDLRSSLDRLPKTAIPMPLAI
jgi:hypothetical protein